MITKKNFIALFLILKIVAGPEIRYLTPPRLSQENILKQVICYRPVRLEKPRIELENSSSKTIIHAYGHGSGGWTLGPGSAQYAVNLLPQLPQDTPLVIVGAGVIGLFVAYNLVKIGYTNITLIAFSFEDLTSHKAGGLFAYMSGNADPVIRSFVNNLAIESHKVYAQIAQQQHQDFRVGARYIPAYFTSREKSDLEAYVGIVMEPAKDVIVDFQNGTQRSLVVYDDCIFINTIYLMGALQQFLRNYNVQFVEQKVNSFDELNYPVIFNCTGRGAQELAHDNSVYSAQGHLLMLKDQDPTTLNYMIEVGINQGVTDDGFEISRHCYLFPKELANAQAGEIGVLGGTFIKKATEATPHHEEFDRMLENARRFFGIETAAIS